MKRSRFEVLRNEEPGGAGEPNTAAGGAGGANTASEPPPWMSSDGKFVENWHTNLGDEFSPHAAQLGTYKDIKGLAKSLIHFRANGPTYPTETSSPDDVTRFRTLAGVPETGTSEAYGFTIPEAADEHARKGYELIAKVAHENHLNGPGVAKLVAAFEAHQASEIARMEADYSQQQKAAQDALVASWRGDFEGNKSTVRHIAEKLAATAGIEYGDPSLQALADNPSFSRIMLEVSKLTQNDSIRTPAGMGDLRSHQQQADDILAGTCPIWGKKYQAGTKDEKLAAYREYGRLHALARA